MAHTRSHRIPPPSVYGDASSWIGTAAFFSLVALALTLVL